MIPYEWLAVMIVVAISTFAWFAVVVCLIDKQGEEAAEQYEQDEIDKDEENES